MKKELEKETQELVEFIKPLFRNFCSGYIDEEAYTKVYKKNGFWCEDIVLHEPAGLCYLEVNRHYYFKSEYSDDHLKIIIRWFDWSDGLIYESNYFAQMSNKAVSERVKIMLEAATSSAKLSHKIRKEEETNHDKEAKNL